MIYKLKFKSPTIQGQTLFFTTNDYLMENDFITFTDKYGKKQTWSTSFLINIEEVKE